MAPEAPWRATVGTADLLPGSAPPKHRRDRVGELSQCVRAGRPEFWRDGGRVSVKILPNDKVNVKELSSPFLQGTASRSLMRKPRTISGAFPPSRLFAFPGVVRLWGVHPDVPDLLRPTTEPKDWPANTPQWGEDWRNRRFWGEPDGLERQGPKTLSAIVNELEIPQNIPSDQHSIAKELNWASNDKAKR